MQLHHSLRIGASFDYAIEVEALLSFANTAKDSSMRFVLHFAATVQGVEEGVARVRHRLQRIEARTHSPVADTNYDSADAGTDPGTFRQLSLLIDKVFVVLVDGSGHIEQIELPKEMPRGADHVAGTDFESLFELYFVPLPRGVVEVGTSWDSKVKLIDAAIATGNRAPVTNTLTGVTDGVAQITRKYHLRAPRRPGVEFEILKSEGAAALELESGRIVTTRMELVAKARRQLGDGKVAEGTSSVTVTVRTTPPGDSGPQTPDK